MNPKSLWAKLRRIFTEGSLPSAWESQDVFVRYFYYNVLIIVCSLFDMNLFVLKLWLWIPTDHPIILFRSMLAGFTMIVSARQGYFFATDEKCDFLGSQAWVTLVTIMTECVIAYKISP